jgi:hypothetical protein
MPRYRMTLLEVALGFAAVVGIIVFGMAALAEIVNIGRMLWAVFLMGWAR